MIKINEPEDKKITASGTQAALNREGVWKPTSDNSQGERLIVLKSKPLPIYFGTYKDGRVFSFVPEWEGELEYLGPIDEVEITIKQD